jgi:hypothetical protein
VVELAERGLTGVISRFHRAHPLSNCHGMEHSVSSDSVAQLARSRVEQKLAAASLQPGQSAIRRSDFWICDLPWYSQKSGRLGDSSLPESGPLSTPLGSVVYAERLSWIARGARSQDCARKGMQHDSDRSTTDETLLGTLDGCTDLPAH